MAVLLNEQKNNIDVFVSLEKYLYEKEGRDHALDKLDSWDEGDIYRLVAVFLGGNCSTMIS